MYLAKRFNVRSYLLWTRREISYLFFWALFVTSLYDFLRIHQLSVELVPIQMMEIIGTALAISLGFKNQECFARGREALANWEHINSASIVWAKKMSTMPSDSQSEEAKSRLRRMYHRHFAWLTVMRFSLRESQIWENLNDPGTARFIAECPTPEMQSSLDAELAACLSVSELEKVLAHRGDKATFLLARQYDELAGLFRNGIIGDRVFQILAAATDDIFKLQNEARRIKNFPYPRNFYSINQILVWGFCGLAPFAFFPFALDLGKSAGIEGWTVWLNIVFSLLVGWVFVTLEKVGEHSSNPFEGNVNDVPISALARQIEIEMRLMLGDQTELKPLEPKYNILF